MVSTSIDLVVPSSKSGTHRAFLLAALSSVPCVVRRPLWGADCESTLAVLKAMGARAQRLGNDVHFTPVPDLSPPQTVLDCGNSGTTLRLLSGQAARLPGPVTLTGDASLQSRPNGPLLDALTNLGAHTDSNSGRAPLTVTGPLHPGIVELPAKVSSQYGSSLLLTLGLLPGPSTLRMRKPVSSRPYLEITRQVAADFHLAWTVHDLPDALVFEIPGGQRPRAESVAVAGDWSGAAFPLVASALSGVPVGLHGLRADDPQGDKAVVDLLGRFGQHLSWDGNVLRLAPRPLQPAGTLDLGPTPDLFPALVSIAACSPGTTELVGAPSLRHKESDRISAMAAVLSAVGVRCEERPDGLRVHGGSSLSPAKVESLHDHRIYMASRLLGLVEPGIAVDGAGCERVSYPDFEAQLARFATAQAEQSL
jgi:3-phosphoshikimate 1-carboxyvinyltransferase